MTAYIAKAIALWRFDRWLLLRAPLLWRTRLPSLLVLLSLAVIVAIPLVLMLTSIEVRTDVIEVASNTMLWWYLQLWGVAVVVMWWVGFIVTRNPVGELAPRRHVVTVLAVTIGSYLLLITPSVFAYTRINAINRVGPSNHELNTDLEIVSRYSNWDCVPSDVLNKADELEKLRNIFVSYSAKVPDFKNKKPDRFCTIAGAVSLDIWIYARRVVRTINTIGESRRLDPFGEKGFEMNESRRLDLVGVGFDAIRIGLYWWHVVAFGIGVLTAILHYPGYVWRRIFLRR